eukprot:TRINITY_DN3026_c0_g1_i5.p1 TRINITY_DN3026_c0_g1~~TRINITY_DN3026_c0_g1_i5.p1  ORF type:complete len:286 (-),score=60.03 TRINITY_DN3026_c0_g1_i5:289-1146(-)
MIQSGIYLLGTYRCQSATNRLNMKIRTMEGRYGTLMTYIIPRSTPKCCQVVSHPIKPLSLHQRIASIDEESIGRPLNELRITGSFGLAEAHAWVIFCLPDVPEKVTTEDVFYCFQSTFLGTYLFCRYKKGYLVLRSDSISTISILKEAIAKEATMRKTTISVNVDIKDESIPHFLTLVHPKFEYQFGLATKVRMIEALKEVKLQEENVSFLAPEFQQILESPEKLQQDYEVQPRRLEFLYGIIIDLYVDKFKFKGQDVRARIPVLMSQLQNYSLDNILNFFSEPV